MPPIADDLYKRLMQAPVFSVTADQWGEVNISLLDDEVYVWGIDRKGQTDWIEARYSLEDFARSRHAKPKVRRWLAEVIDRQEADHS